MKTNQKIWLIASLYFAVGFLITNGEIFCDVLNLDDIRLCRFASLIDGAAGALVFLANVMVFAVVFVIALFSKTLRRTALIVGFLALLFAFLIFASRAVFVRIVLPFFSSDSLADANVQITPAPVVTPISTHRPEFFTYLNELQSHIKKNWSWEDKDSVLVTKVFIEIEPDGTVKSVAIKKASGNSEFDQAVLVAIQKAAPVPASPSTVYEHFKSVVLTFDSRE